jgi:transcriptional regulator with XRE-family HTH domain
MAKAKAGEDIEAVYEEIGRRIRWVREQQGKRAWQLAEAACAHASTVSAWELGTMRLRVAELLLICNYLEVSPTVLLDALPIEQCRPTPKQAAERQARGAIISRYFAGKRKPDGQQKKGARKKRKGAKP